MMLFLFYLLAISFVIFVILMKDLIDIQKARLRYIRAHQRLLDWRKVRPFIYYGSCPYCRSLINEMIDAYRFLLAMGYVTNRDYLRKLEMMLNRFPPFDDPPRRVFLFGEAMLESVHFERSAQRKGASPYSLAVVPNGSPAALGRNM
ncbi:MAG TPA: hypothetical protein VGE31_02320 [Candidatus Paceibacterota bacterium]